MYNKEIHIITLLFFIIGISLVYFFPNQGGDWDTYARVAQNIVDGNGISLSTYPPYIPCYGGNQPPGYPLFLALFNVNMLSSLFTQTAILIFSIALFNKFYGFIPTLFSLLFIAWGRFIQPESLCVSLILIFLCVIKSTVSKKEIWLGLIILGSVYLRTDGILLLIPTYFSVGLKRTFIVVSIVIIGLSPWIIRNTILGVNIIQKPMTVVNSERELYSPTGYILWCWTWASNEFSTSGWAFPICRASYSTLYFPPEAYANEKEKQLVTQLISELVNYNGTDFPKYIDEQFRVLAMTRIKANFFIVAIRLPLKRLIALWFHPGHSHAFPGELRELTPKMKQEMDINKLTAFF
jgi:hypothetical protein